MKENCLFNEMQCLVTGVHCEISLQNCFYPSSPPQDLGPVFFFVRDLENIDDVFEMASFWARDPQGLEPLSPADIITMGLDGALPYKMSFDLWYLSPLMLEELRIFHEVLGFAADSPDIPRILGSPIASVEWDGTPIFSMILFVTDYLKPQDTRMALQPPGDRWSEECGYFD